MKFSQMIIARASVVGLMVAFFTTSALAAELGLGKHAPAKPDVTKIVVESGVKHQTIDNFSASDGWSMQFVGLWPKQKVEKMADWLFSSENDEQGQPKGIGLSLWRFNIGTGSAEQGDSSKIDNVWTRSECFLKSDGSYDWNKQYGQRSFMQMAKKRGVNQFLGFILSPPVYWTQNGLATNMGRGATFNLKENRYLDFARFTADVAEGIQKHDGIMLDYICPFNEPDGHWNWVGSNQEGTAATNNEIAKLVRLMGREFETRKLKTQILVTESFDYNCMFRTHPYTKPNRGYQIQSFFSPDSVKTYIGNTPNVPKLMAAHTYWTNTPISALKDIRVELGDKLRKYGLNYWQTEFCIMSNDEEIGGGHGVDLGMKTALYVARVIHHDLVCANAAAWQWWRAVGTGNYRDGLIYAESDETLKDGKFTDSKLMWTLGNYSRFIRPGAVRLGISAYNKNGKLVKDGDTDPYALMVSAYVNTDKTPVIVVVNYSLSDRALNIKWNGIAPKEWQPYRTSDLQNESLSPLMKIKYGGVMTIPARSVTTFVGI